MKIDVSKLKVTLPEGVTKKSEPTLDPDGVSVKFKVTGDRANSYDLGVSYDNGEPVNCKLTVKDATLIKIYDNILGVVAGKNFTVRAQFDLAPALSDVKITVPSDWTESVKAYIEGNDVIAVYTTKNIVETAEVSVEYKGQVKKLNINVRDPQINSFKTLESDKSEYSVSEDIVLTATYTHDVAEKDKPEVGQLPEGVTEKTPLASSGKTWTATYTSTTPGEKTFTFVAYKGDKINQAARMCKVTVN